LIHRSLPARLIPEGFRRYSGAQLLGALILLIITVPFVRHLKIGTGIEAVLLSVVLLSAVLAVGGRRRTLVAGILLMAPAEVGRWVNHVNPGVFSPTLVFVFSLLFVAFVIIHHLLFVLRAPRVNSEVLCAGISTYLMMGILWAFAYGFIAELDSGSFIISAGPAQHRHMQSFEALYFSLCTLCGLSFGDFTPVTDVSRMLAMLEGMVGTFYLAILIARLVSLYSAEPKK
jgi:ion channel